MVTLFVFLQLVAVIVSVRVYVVVIVGLTDGFAEVEENPEGLLVHEYVLPLTALAPIVVELPLQMVLALPALAVGNGFTVMTTEFDLLQEVAVTDSTNV